MKVLALITAISLSACSMSTVAPLPYDDKNGIDNDGIRQTVRSHQAEARLCLNDALKDNPALHGKVIMVWDLDKDGHVTESRIKENNTGSTPLGTCLAESSKKWIFPKLRKTDTVTVIYPMVFSRNIK
jgi:hypothetical protein